MNHKMTTNSQLSTTEPKKKKTKKLEENHRNGDHMEGYQWGRGEGRMGEKVQEISSVNDRYKIDRRRLRIV